MKTLFIKRFQYYKNLGDQSFDQLTEEQLFWQYNAESNSIAIIVKHLAGNMISRWTNFLKEDGEKSWRNRDSEFENSFQNNQEMLDYWEKGWDCLFRALEPLRNEDMNEIILIRQEKHTVFDAILRQLAHYPYHIGQIVYIAKMCKNQDWETLSIAKNASETFNQKMLEKSKISENQENSSPVCFAKSQEVRDDYQV